MRKNRPKNYLKLGMFFFLVLTTVNSCQKESELQNHIEQETKGIKVRTLYKNEISKNTAIINRLSEFNDRTKLYSDGSSARLITSETYNFTIDTETARYIEQGTYHSYTFLVKRDGDIGLVENLMFSLQNDGSYKIILITYDLTSQEQIDVINGLAVDFYDKVTFILIEDNTLLTEVFNRSTTNNTNCYEEVVIVPGAPCNSTDNHAFGEGCEWEGTDHPGAPQPPVTILVMTNECFWSGTGPNDGGDTGGGSGTGDPDDPNDPNDDLGGGLASPVIPVETKDCTELKTNSDNTIFKQQMSVLNDAVNGNQEKIFGIYNGSYFDPEQLNPACGPISNDGNENEPGDIAYHQYLKAIAHNHLKAATETRKHIGTFSPNDLINFSNLMVGHEDENSPIRLSELTSCLICEEGNYALKITNSDKFYNFVVKYDTDGDFKKKVDKFYKKNNMAHGKTKKDQNIGFLKLIRKFDMGTSIYEADVNFENWEQLELNEAGIDINKKPC